MEESLCCPPETITTLCAGDFPGGTVAKHLPDNAGDPKDMGSISGVGRSSEVGKGNPLPVFFVFFFFFLYLFSNFKLFICIRVWPINNVVVVSGEQ